MKLIKLLIKIALFVIASIVLSVLVSYLLREVWGIFGGFADWFDTAAKSFAGLFR